MINRTIELKKYVAKQKVTIVYGARQVGKTTLVKKYIESYKGKYLYFTGDDLEFSSSFSECKLSYMYKMFTGIDLLVIDEAQLIPNIGRALKLVVDNIAGISVIVTGSSSFDLANKTSESLTGRKNVVTLFPLSQAELLKDLGRYALEDNLSDYLRFGSYPEVIKQKTYSNMEITIKSITNSYLLKDIFVFDLIKGSKVILDLLRLLSFQIGSEVSMSELGTKLGIDKKTVGRYLDLLEKSFVIFRLDGFSRNLRKEITKMSKYYFYDLGVRNALISNFNNIDRRDDLGQLWENFVLSERLKLNSYSNFSANYYFWRTYDQKELDYIEETAGKLFGYEFKLTKKDVKPPLEWLETYKQATFKVINKENYLDLLVGSKVL